MKIKHLLISILTILSFQSWAQNSVTGTWSPVYNSTGVIPVGATNLPDGRILGWSAKSKNVFGNADGRTYTTIFNPANNSFTERLVSNTGHDMFCPGTANLADGRIMITGGSNSEKTTVYNPANNTFSNEADMNTPRGYHSMVTLSDGRVFTLGGSWSGGLGNKNAEVWSQQSGWVPYPGITADNSIRQGAPDPGGVYRDDNHAWLFQAPNGRVFQAGPGNQMHWFTLDGVGTVINAGNRGNDQYAMNGNCAMYDIGKLLTSGGGQRYGVDPPWGGELAASNKSYIIDINSNNANVTAVGDMKRARTLQNSIVLPNGQVVVVGGLSTTQLFSDNGALLPAEIWDPATNQWTEVASMSVPRTYHSVGILMKDGRVWVGGGGLCGGCDVNHPDVQIFTPPYLYNGNGLANRPNINSAPETVDFNASINVSTNQIINSFVLMRLSSVTHSVNNEQRRVPVTFQNNGGNNYTLNVPNANIVPPGYYYLFAMNNNGVPSVGKTIKVGNATSTGGGAQVVPNGDYFINTAAASNQRLASPDFDNTNVRMVAAADNEEQKWRINHLGDNVYTLQNLKTNRYMEVFGGICENLANVSTYTAANADHQQWIISKVGNDYFFRPKHCQNLGMDRNNGNNLSAILYTFSTGNNNQKFLLTETTNTPPPGGEAQVVVNGDYYINTAAVANQRLANPTSNIGDTRMVAAADNEEQKWRINHLGDNVYTLQNLQTNRYMEVFGGICENLANVSTYTAANADHQQWIISKVGNDYFFRPKHCQNLGMDRNNGNNLSAILYAFSTGNDNQKFLLTPVTDSPPPPPPPPTTATNIFNGIYHLKSKTSNQHLISNASNGFDAIMGAPADFNDQRWDIQHIGDEKHTIKNVDSGRFLEVPGGNCSNAADVGTYTVADGDHHRWFIENIGGNIFIRPVHCSDLALDKATGNVLIWPQDTNNGNQQWELVATAVGARSDFSNSLDVTPEVGRKVALNWSVNQEKEVAQFVIQRAAEDDLEFSDLTTVEAKKESGIKNYYYLHEEPFTGTSFYQIEIEYADGSVDYTPFRSVYFEESALPIHLYPNPVQERLYIDLNNYMDEKVYFYISNQLGQILLYGNFEQGHAIKEEVDFSDPKFSNGNYFIHLRPELHTEMSYPLILSKK